MQKTFTFNLYSVVFFFFILMMPCHCRDCDFGDCGTENSVCLSGSILRTILRLRNREFFLSVCLSECYVPPYYNAPSKGHHSRYITLFFEGTYSVIAFYELMRMFLVSLRHFLG